MLTGEINITDILERAEKIKICDSRPIAVGFGRRPIHCIDEAARKRSRVLK